MGAVRLEYSDTNGVIWTTETEQDGDSMSYTTLTAGTTYQEFIKNESPKNRVYRWRCTSYTSGSIVTYMSKHDYKGKWEVPGSQDIFIIWDDEPPTSGKDGDGAGFAGHGSFFIDTSSDGLTYRNQYTSTMPSWTSI